MTLLEEKQVHVANDNDPTEVATIYYCYFTIIANTIGAPGSVDEDDDA